MHTIQVFILYTKIWSCTLYLTHSMVVFMIFEQTIAALFFPFSYQHKFGLDFVNFDPVYFLGLCGGTEFRIIFSMF